MKTLIGAATALALLTASGLAYALERTGVIDTIDQASATITLQDGSQFLTSKDVLLGQLEPGSEVVITYEEKDGQMIATDVKPAG